MNRYRHISDERMIAAYEYIVAHKLKDTTTLKAWSEAVGIAPSNISNIKKGGQSFSVENIRKCCTHFDISANYIFGISNQIILPAKKESAVERIKAALHEIEQTLKKK